MFVPRAGARPGRSRIYATPLSRATGSRIRTRVSSDRATVTPHSQTHVLSHQLRTTPLPCELHRHRRRHLRRSWPRDHDPKAQPRHVLGLNRPAPHGTLPHPPATVRAPIRRVAGGPDLAFETWVWVAGRNPGLRSETLPGKKQSRGSGRPPIRPHLLGLTFCPKKANTWVEWLPEKIVMTVSPYCRARWT